MKRLQHVAGLPQAHRHALGAEVVDEAHHAVVEHIPGRVTALTVRAGVTASSVVVPASTVVVVAWPVVVAACPVVVAASPAVVPVVEAAVRGLPG